MSIEEKELADERLRVLRGSAETRKSGDISAMADTSEGVPLRGWHWRYRWIKILTSTLH